MSKIRAKQSGKPFCFSLRWRAHTIPSLSSQSEWSRARSTFTKCYSLVWYIIICRWYHRSVDVSWQRKPFKVTMKANIAVLSNWHFLIVDISQNILKRNRTETKQNWLASFTFGRNTNLLNVIVKFLMKYRYRTLKYCPSLVSVTGNSVLL